MTISDGERQDSIDIPECFGEFSKNNKLCLTYCAMSIRCCLMRSRHPKVDVLDKLLIPNHYAVKSH